MNKRFWKKTKEEEVEDCREDKKTDTYDSSSAFEI